MQGVEKGKKSVRGNIFIIAVSVAFYSFWESKKQVCCQLSAPCVFQLSNPFSFNAHVRSTQRLTAEGYLILSQTKNYNCKNYAIICASIISRQYETVAH